MSSFFQLDRLAAYVAVTLFVSLSALGSTLTVTTLVDTDDSICDANCSLRDAIAAAAPGDMIVFAPSIRGGNIQLTRTLVIDKSVTIDGPNKRRISLTADPSFRAIHVRIAGTMRVVTLDGLIIRKGGAPDGDGGGILLDPEFQATINLVNCAVFDNSAQRGGGIYMNFGTLFVVDSTIANNTATGNGSAGGIETFQGTLQIINSTISANKSLGTADGVGGVRFTGSRNWRIVGSTIAFNSSNGIAGTSAGGVAALNGIPGPIVNTILAKNTGAKPDFTGRFSGARHILIGAADASLGLTDGVDGNIVGSVKFPVDPMLAQLTDNGGTIFTHALAPESRAINAGSNIFSTDRQGNPETKDQRRFIRIADTTVDIGSFESNSQPLPYLATVVGRVTRSDGRGIAGVHVSLRGPNGDAFTGISNPFGYYRIANVAPDLIYEIEFRHKSYPSVTSELLIEESVEYRSEILGSLGAAGPRGFYR